MAKRISSVVKNIMKTNIAIKPSIETEKEFENSENEVVFYQLIDPKGNKVGKPYWKYEEVWTQASDDGRKYNFPKDCLLDRVQLGYKVVEIVYVPSKKKRRK